MANAELLQQWTCFYRRVESNTLKTGPSKRSVPTQKGKTQTVRVSLQEHRSVRHQYNRISQWGLHKAKPLLIPLQDRWLQLCIAPCTSPETSATFIPFIDPFLPAQWGSRAAFWEHFSSFSTWLVLLCPTSRWGRSSKQPDTPNSLPFRNPVTYCQGQQCNPSQYFDTSILKHPGFISYH